MTPERPILRYHGGKFRLAPWLMQFFPPHMVYVEPFGGAASVLMQKPRSHGEVYNDLDGDMVNVFRVLQRQDLRECLAELLEVTPYAREEFELAWEQSDDPVERARRTFIRAEMGFGSAGATKGRTGFRIDTVRNYGTAMTVWAKVPEKLAAFGQRLQGVLIENRPAIRVLVDHDTPQTLFYADPPYLHETRVIEGGRYYKHEMTNEGHAEFLKAICEVEGMAVVSGYPSDTYDAALRNWQRYETKSRIAARRGTAHRTEVVWLNPACTAALEATRRQPHLIG
jgi:DNA adenine methylase